MKRALMLFAIVILGSFGCKKNPVGYTNREVKKLTAHNHSVFLGKYTPNGEKIIYVLSDDEGSDIYSTDAEGKKHSVLLENIGRIATDFIISSNSVHISFVGSRNTTSGVITKLHLYDINKASDQILAENNDGIYVASFSPDGLKILYSQYHGINSVHTIDINGANDKKLSGEVNTIPVAFSIGGGKILFTSNPDGFRFNAFTMNLNGGDIKRITPIDMYLVPISYTQDGKKILCRAHITDDGQHNREVFVVNSDGMSLQRITNNSYQDYPVAFSPDGTKILFYSDNNGSDSTEDWEIYLINSDGTELMRLTDNKYRDLPLEFSPDGRKILFQSDRDGLIALYAMKLD